MALTDTKMTTEVVVPGDTHGKPMKLTADYISGLAKAASEYFRAFHKQCDDEDSYYYGTRPVPAPKNADPVRPATARAIVDVATDHVDVNNISIDIPLMRRSKARAERLKHFYIAHWLNQKAPVLRTAAKHEFQYGIGFLVQMFDVDMWYDHPRMEDYGVRLEDSSIMMVRDAEYKADLRKYMERRKMRYPLVTKTVPPRQMLWDDSETGPKWAIRQVATKVSDLRRKYGDTWMPNRRSEELIEWLEYWDDTHYAFLAGGMIVKGPELHGYGFMPYIPIVPGNSLNYSTGNPEERFQGILKPVHSLLDAEARLTTQISQITRRFAWPAVDIHGNRVAADEVADTYELDGKFNTIPPGIEIRPSPVPPVPPDLWNNLSMVQSMIEDATFPNVVKGTRTKGASSGFQVSVMAGMGRLRFGAYADALARALEKCNSGAASLLENRIRTTLSIHARTEVHDFDDTIKPEDIRGYLENKVTLKAEAPEERERESLLAMRLYQSDKPIISLYEAMRRVGIVSPLQEMDQMAAEVILQALRPEQLEELKQRLGQNFLTERQTAAGMQPGAPPQQAPPQQRPPQQQGGTGTRYEAGQAQLQRPGEAGIQRQRIQSRQQEATFPSSLGGLDLLGSKLSAAGGSGIRLPSGGRSP